MEYSLSTTSSSGSFHPRKQRMTEVMPEKNGPYSQQDKPSARPHTLQSPTLSLCLSCHGPHHSIGQGVSVLSPGFPACQGLSWLLQQGHSPEMSYITSACTPRSDRQMDRDPKYTGVSTCVGENCSNARGQLVVCGDGGQARGFSLYCSHIVLWNTKSREES